MDLDRLKNLRSLMSEGELLHLMQEDGFTEEMVQEALSSLNIDLKESESKVSNVSKNLEMANHISQLRAFMNDDDIRELLISEGYALEQVELEIKHEIVADRTHTSSLADIETVAFKEDFGPIFVNQNQLYVYDLYFHHSPEISQEDSYVIKAVYERLERCGYKCCFDDSFIMHELASSSSSPSSLMKHSHTLSKSKVLIVFLDKSYWEHIKKQKSEGVLDASDFEYIQDLISKHSRPTVFFKLDSSSLCDSSFCDCCLTSNSINDNVYTKFMNYYNAYSVDISCFKQMISTRDLYNRWKESERWDPHTNECMLRCLLALFKTLGQARIIFKRMNCTTSLAGVIVAENVEDLI